MENFISSFEQRGTSQKILIVIGVTLILLVFIIVMSIITNPKPKLKTEALSTPAPTTTGLTTLPTDSASESVILITDGYKITYPGVWKKQVLTVETGGTLTDFTHSDNNNSEAFPRIDIQVTNAGTNITNQERIANMSVLNLASSTSNFKGQGALKLSGILPFDFALGNTIKKVNKTFLFMTVGGKDYVIDYAYYQDENAQQSLRQINQILDSFSFQ